MYGLDHHFIKSTPSGQWSSSIKRSLRFSKQEGNRSTVANICVNELVNFLNAILNWLIDCEV